MNKPKGFHAFTIKGAGGLGLDRLITDIAVTPAFDLANPPPIPPTPTPTKSLWDTGASRSCLSVTFAQKMGLQPVGKCKVYHGDGLSDRFTYLVNFFLPNKVQVTGLLVSEFVAHHDNFDVLVGMDVMRLGDLSISNVNGNTWFSFRTPSLESVDYVADANALTRASVGRNDPCICKSGKKFKKCCGANL